MRNRSTPAKLLIILLVSLVALFTVHAALAQDNPPGCKNPTPGDPGNKNPNCHEGPEFGNCSDGIDNDGDGLVDGDDPDCQVPPTQEGPPGDATCSDGIDNDQDGAIDGADSDCQTPPTTEGPPGDETCSDGIDNDQDGAIDGADSDCVPGPTTEGPPGDPTCSDTIDNDQDGATDGADSDCQTPPTTEGPPGDPTCTDGIDNDQDGATDSADSGCQTPPVEKCTADAGDPGLLTGNTLGQEIWDGGGDALSPLTENPEHNGVISGPLNDALNDTPLEVVGDEASCALDLLLDETVSPIDP